MRDGKETDFLIVRDGKPLDSVFEAKLEDEPIDKHHFDHARMLGNLPFIKWSATATFSMRGRSGSQPTVLT